MSAGVKELARKLIPAPAWNWCKMRARDVLFDLVLPAAYRRAARKGGVDGRLALFIEMDKPEISSSLELAWRAMRDVYGYDTAFFSIGAHRVGFFRRAANLVQLAGIVARARFVFICEAMNPVACLPLDPRTKVVQLWHGCGAFKKFGMSTADKIFGGTREEKLRHPAHRNTALVTVSSPEVEWAYVEAMGLEATPQVVQPLGISRTDVFFDAAYLEAARAEALAAVPACRGRRVVAYAPTFRGRVATAEAPDALDIPLMKRVLGEGWVLLVKHHPHVKDLPPIPPDCRDFAFDVTRSLSIESLLAAADVCVSDYSSLVYEASLLGLPMAFFAYDLDDYDDWRGFYYDYDEMTPGPIFTETADLADWVAHVDERFDAAEVSAFREKFMGSCDGHSTERICETALAL